MKKVVLLNPPSDIPCSRVLHRANVGKPGYIWPPVDFVCLSGYLWDAGYALTYKDFQLDKNTSIWDFFENQNSDVIISSYCPYFEHEDLGVLRKLKEKYPLTDIILLANHKDRLDGTHSEHLLQHHDFVTAIIYDFAYNNVASFIEGDRTDNIFNVFFFSNNTFHHRRKHLPEILDIPLPRHELFQSNKYFHYESAGDYLTSTMSSFGCKMNCSFCWGPQLYPHVSTRSAENLIEEMLHIVQCGIHEVYFHDLTLGYHTENLLRFCRLMVAEGIQLRWFCSSRFDVMTPETIQAMGKAGCRCIEFGLESGNYQVRKLYGKDISNQRIEEVVRLCKEQGIRVAVFLLLGLPEENLFDMEHSVAFAKKLDVDYLALNVPWAESFTTFQEKVTPDSRATPREYARSINFDHPYVSQEDIKKLYQRSFRSFYLNPRFISRQIIGLRSWKRVKNMYKIVKALLKKENI